MKKRLLSMVLTVIMLVSLIPTSVFAAKKSVDDYFDGLPIAADPGTGTTAWKVSTKDGEEVLMSGNAGKNYSSSTLTLTFTEDTHLSFEYKVSSEAKYDKCTITLGSNTLVNGESGDQEWKEGSGAGRQAGRQADCAVQEGQQRRQVRRLRLSAELLRR